MSRVDVKKPKSPHNFRKFGVIAIILTPGACGRGSRVAVDDTGSSGSGACPLLRSVKQQIDDYGP